MEITPSKSFTGPEGSFARGRPAEVSDEYGTALVEAGYAAEVNAKPSKPSKPSKAKKATKATKATSKPKTETASKADDDVETASTD